MASIDWGSIMMKAEACMNSPKMEKKVEEYVDEVIVGRIVFRQTGSKKAKTIEEAADKFIEVLSNEINQHVGTNFSKGNISELARDALCGLDYGKPYKVGDNYCINVWFENELHRESLLPKEWDGIDNIAALLNSGYIAGGAVYGEWIDHNQKSHGDVWSLRKRAGAHFVEQAISDFMGNYATEYNVIKIEASDDYRIRND